MKRRLKLSPANNAGPLPRCRGQPAGRNTTAQQNTFARTENCVWLRGARTARRLNRTTQWRHAEVSHDFMPSEVQRLLISGDDDQLTAFHLLVCMVANAIERREQTIFYTVMADDLAGVMEVAKATGVTVQQKAKQAPWWPVVLQGKTAAWTPQSNP